MTKTLRTWIMWQTRLVWFKIVWMIFPNRTIFRLDSLSCMASRSSRVSPTSTRRGWSTVTWNPLMYSVQKTESLHSIIFETYLMETFPIGSSKGTKKSYPVSILVQQNEFWNIISGWVQVSRFRVVLEPPGLLSTLATDHDRYTRLHGSWGGPVCTWFVWILFDQIRTKWDRVISPISKIAFFKSLKLNNNLWGDYWLEIRFSSVQTLTDHYIFVLRKNKHTTASDIWSFGVLIFEMTFGRLPFGEKSTHTLLVELSKPTSCEKCEIIGKPTRYQKSF